MRYQTLKSQRKQNNINYILNRLSDEPISAHDFVEPLKMEKTHIQSLLRSLEKKGKCVSIQTIKGSVGELRKYYLAADIDSETLLSITEELNKPAESNFRKWRVDYSTLSPKLALQYGYRSYEAS